MLKASYSWEIPEPAYCRATYKINVLLNKHNSYYYNFTLIYVFPTSDGMYKEIASHVFARGQKIITINHGKLSR